MVNLCLFSDPSVNPDADSGYTFRSWWFRRDELLVVLDIREHDDHPVEPRRAFISVWERGEKIASGVANVLENGDIHFDDSRMIDFLLSE